MSPNFCTHRCRHCAREFSRAEHLTRHERIHTKEKPFKCDQCPSAFSRVDLLRRHEKKAHPIRTRNSSQHHRSPSQNPSLGKSTSSQGQESLITNLSNQDNSIPPVFDQLPSFLVGDASNESIPQCMPMLQNFDFDCNMQDVLLPDEILWFDHIQSIEPSFTSPSTEERHISHLTLPNSDESTALSRLGSPDILESPGAGDVIQLVCNYTVSEERWSSIEDELSQYQISLPSRTRLSQFVRRYLHSFHSHQPFIHTPTWSPNTSNLALLLAMCAGGAQYSLETEAASQLRKAAISCLPYQREDIQVLQALMILSADAAWSGSPDRLRTALGYYGQMAMMIRSEWNRSCQVDHEQPMSWERWIEIESLRRITFCVFTLMNLITIAYDIPSLVILEDKYGIPCQESQWLARTKEEWVEATQILPTDQCGSGPTILKQLFDEQLPIPQQVGMFSCHITISSLVQQIILFRKSTLQFTTHGDVTKTTRRFHIALKRWQLMWESEPRAVLSPNSPHGPMLFNCTALLRVAYVRLASDYSFTRGLFSLESSNPVAMIEKAIQNTSLPPRNDTTTRAALHSCLALQVPVKLGLKLVARTSFWVWSVQHAVCYFECAILLGSWLQMIASCTDDLSGLEWKVVELLQQLLDLPQCDRSADTLRSMAPAVLRGWSQLLDTKESTVWNIIPRLSDVLALRAESLTNE